MVRILTTFAALLAGTSAHADTQILFECGGSSGHAFYPPSIFVEAPEGEWIEDGISNGRIQLVRSGDELDLLHLDALGMTSARSYNAEILVLDVTDKHLTVLVNYEGGAKEMYTYDPQAQSLYWSQHKFGVMIDKVASFTSDCH